MVRVSAIIGILLLLSGWLIQRHYEPSRGGLDVHHTYLVVDVEGPPDWRNDHTFSIVWKDQKVSLPIVFKVPMGKDRAQFSMGSAGENFARLRIGELQIPVKGNPDVQFHVRNSAVMTIINEESSKPYTAAVSIANLVYVCPPEYVDQHDIAIFSRDKLDIVDTRLEVRLKQLLNEGRLIEVTENDLLSQKDAN